MECKCCVFFINEKCTDGEEFVDSATGDDTCRYHCNAIRKVEYEGTKRCAELERKNDDLRAQLEMNADVASNIIAELRAQLTKYKTLYELTDKDLLSSISSSSTLLAECKKFKNENGKLRAQLARGVE